MLERPHRDLASATWHDDGQPHALRVDIETRGIVDLRVAGPYRYSGDQHTEFLCLALAVDDGPVETCLASDLPHPAFKTAAITPGWIVEAHNAVFDRSVYENILIPRFDCPPIAREKWCCTMAAAAALALPLELGLLARVLHLPHQKNPAGQRAMQRLARPRRARKGEDPNGVYWEDDPELLEQLYERNRLDVEILRDVSKLLGSLPPNEQVVWTLDQRINDRGVHFDRGLIEAARKIVAAARPEIDAELVAITSGAVSAATQVARLQAWLRQQGFELETVNRKAVQKLLASELPPAVRHALELRLVGGQAAARKLDTLLASLDDDGRVRGLFRYHGASTGRWTSSRVQIQNLKRTQLEDVDAAVAAIATGDYNVVRAQYPDPLALAGECLRPMICAPLGRMLIGGDFTTVEPRTAAWLAEEHSKLEIFRRFDASQDPNDDPYVIMAGFIFHKPAETITAEQRQVGKFCELAFGYQGGLGAFRKIAPDADFSDAEIEKFKFAWRAAHPNIERFWHAINRATISAVCKPNVPMRCGRITAEFNGAFLYVTLPSGRELAYPSPRLVEDREHGCLRIVYKDNAAGRWRDERLYGGKLTENIISAIARDVLAASMLRVEAAGFAIILHVHDELVVEMPENSVDLAEFTRLVTAVPTWAEGLPIAAKAWSGRRYAK